MNKKVAVHEDSGTHHNVIAIVISLDSDKDDADAMDTLKECAEKTAQFIEDFTPYHGYVDCTYDDPVNPRLDTL